MLDPELVRYIEYLQRQMIDPAYAEAMEPSRLVEWLKSSPESLRRLYEDHFGKNPEIFDEHVSEALRFEPQFAHDTFHSSAAFLKVLKEVETVCRSLNVSPKNSVVLANNSSIGLSPLARPSTGDHVLFAGHGTMALCNYWAKSYSMLLYEFSQKSLPKPLNQVDLKPLVQQYPDPILLMSRLLLYYAYHETLLGFGEVPIRAEHQGLRLDLLKAMEIFAIGHEIGHFVYEERNPSAGSSPGAEHAHKVEFFCDHYGQAISRWYGADSTNWSCFTNSGAIIYLHAGSLSLRLRKRLKGETSEDIASESHPRTWDRIERAVKIAIACVPDDQAEGVRRYLNEIVAVMRFVEAEIFPIVASSIDQAEE
jgi:hypothetical protein